MLLWQLVSTVFSAFYLTIHSEFFSDLRDINNASYKFYNCEIKSCYLFIYLLIISLFLY